MSAHLSEEEQVEALKRWWKENGTSTIATIAIALGGYFGWQYWQSAERQSAEAASALYQEMTEALSTQPGRSLDDTSIATASHLGGQLKTEHKNSLYAQQAGLLLAKLAVQKDDLETAAAELETVLAQNPDDGIELVARLRLAKVRYAQADYDAALTLLNVENTASFTAAFEDLKGDALLAKGDTQLARAAYQLALSKVLPQASAQRELLEMKLNELQAPVAADAGEDA